MSRRQTSFALAAAFLCAASLFSGCESTGEAPSSTVYYGAGYGSSPWYYDGDYDHDYDVIVTPPPGTGDVRPEHPIAYPPGSNRPDRPSRPPSASQLPASSRPSA